MSYGHGLGQNQKHVGLVQTAAVEGQGISREGLEVKAGNGLKVRLLSRDVKGYMSCMLMLAAAL